jgi:L-aminopeptidase/D-esterase-like protein
VRNLITDVPGVKVGSAHDARAATGVTVAVFERGACEATALPHATSLPDCRQRFGR